MYFQTKIYIYIYLYLLTFDKKNFFLEKFSLSFELIIYYIKSELRPVCLFFIKKLRKRLLVSFTYFMRIASI